MGWEYERLPCNECASVYKCPVATVEAPDGYFEWILSCYTLQQAGFTIENERLSLKEWRDLGILKSLLESKKEHENLSMVTQEMLSMVVELTKRRK